MRNYSDDNGCFGDFGLETVDTAHSQRVSSSHVIDLRRNHRIDTNIKARIICEYGKVEGFVINLSRSGLRFEAGSELSDLLTRGSGRHVVQSQEVIEVCFDVPVQGAQDRPVIVQARAVYVIDGDEGKYNCGVEFKVFAEGEQAIKDYIQARGTLK